MIRVVHRSAGAIAFLTIAAFWTSTVYTELFAGRPAIASVKTAIPYGLIVLVPALVAAGGSGFRLARGRRGGVLGAKARRMPIIAANGILVLAPAAFLLAAKARAGEFDAVFYAVQLLEIIAGATNLMLIGMNIRDGLRLSGRVHKRAAFPPAVAP
jgi:hypothetical protein